MARDLSWSTLCDAPRKRVARKSCDDKKFTTTSGVRSLTLMLYHRNALCVC